MSALWELKQVSAQAQINLTSHITHDHPPARGSDPESRPAMSVVQRNILQSMHALILNV